MRIALLTASPRPGGNSRALAAAFTDGARSAGHDVDAVDLNDRITGFLRDCRTCRRPDGSCSIADGQRELVHDVLVPADAVVFAAPLYFYGAPAVLKTVVDRLVCYLSGSYPRHAEVEAGLRGQRVALLLSSEEWYPALSGGLVQQFGELCRYLQQDFVAVVHGVGNSRGEIVRDPSDPLAAATALGRELFERRVSDYTVATERAGSVWSA